MISFTVRLTFEEGDREKVAEIVRELIAPSRQEPGCISYLPHFVAGEASTVLIYEQYLDEAALEYHRNSPHFKELAAGSLYKLRHTRKVEHLQIVE